MAEGRRRTGILCPGHSQANCPYRRLVADIAVAVVVALSVLVVGKEVMVAVAGQQEAAVA